MNKQILSFIDLQIKKKKKQVNYNIWRPSTTASTRLNYSTAFSQTTQARTIEKLRNRHPCKRRKLLKLFT